MQLVQCPAGAVILYSYYKHNRAKEKSNKKESHTVYLYPKTYEKWNDTLKKKSLDHHESFARIRKRKGELFSEFHGEQVVKIFNFPCHCRHVFHYCNYESEIQFRNTTQLWIVSD